MLPLASFRPMISWFAFHPFLLLLHPSQTATSVFGRAVAVVEDQATFWSSIVGLVASQLAFPFRNGFLARALRGRKSLTGTVTVCNVVTFVAGLACAHLRDHSKCKC